MPVDLKQELMPCVRCGQCRSVCPVFLAKGVESDAPRGRVTLVRALLEGRIDPTDILNEKIQQCLLCRTCVQECPSGVHVERIIIAAREKLAGVTGISREKKLVVRWLLPNLQRLRLFLPVIARVQGLLARRVNNSDYQAPRFNVPLAGRRLLPVLTGHTIATMSSGGKPFPATASSLKAEKTGVVAGANMTPEAAATDNGLKKQARVAFFTGCLMNYGYPHVGRDVVEVLQRNLVEVVIPEKQVCCGLPMLAAGDRNTFNRMREENLRALRSIHSDAVITACASCGSTLKEFYAGELEAPIYDFSEFLLAIDFRPPRGTMVQNVTYHDPCHLRKAQGIKSQPRQLLKSVPGLTLKEVSNPDRCCGFGGTFSLTYPDLARTIGVTKVKDLMQTGADTVVTACPGCMLQLASGLYSQGSQAKVLHLAELLAASYRAEE
ncbi:(Fe-S)-binding protein [Moorella sulfitireducens]|uniref:(Fe-S)-binding protein n=1 Tax=Neomoorella sulfitireducens TaxID=2972948 RepID=UPI0021ACAB39|nr:(Fe-S)-binding protein [Moorella sulfitireducens]